MKICIYSRVSTSEQDVQNQYTVLTEWAKQRGFEVVAVYQEEESAWKAGHQKELAKLLADAKKRKVSGGTGLGVGPPEPRRRSGNIKPCPQVIRLWS